MDVGFDIGGTFARAATLGPSGEASEVERRRIREETAPRRVAELVAEMLSDLGDTDSPSSVRSLGIALAAQLDPSRRIVRNAPNLGWRDVPFADMLEDVLGDDAPSVSLANDLNASIWGEHLEGALENVDDALAIFVGTGVGGAVLVGGELVVGHDGVAGEIGHAKIEPGGRLCGCGERGCLEAYAGGIHLERQVREELDVDGSDAIDLEDLDDRSRDDAGLRRIWERATDGLAVVAANACTLLDPEVLLLGGGIVEHCAHFRELFTAKVPPLVLEAGRDGLELRRPELGDEAGLLGAARLAVRRRREAP